MKKILFLIMIVGCFAGLAFGTTPILQNDFSEKSNIEDFVTINSLLQTNGTMLSSTTAIDSHKIAAESNRSLCSSYDPDDDDDATMNPSCYDMASGDDPPDDPHGDSHKGAIPFAQSQDLVAKYYILNPSTQVYEFSEQKQLVSYISGGSRFYYDLPTWNDEEGNTFYKIVIEDIASGGNGYITHGYLEIVYPTFIILPPGFPY